MTSSHTSSTPAASAIRPRNRRLISYLDEGLDSDINSVQTTRIASPRDSPYHSRPASPIPSKHPSRPTVRSTSSTNDGLLGGFLQNDTQNSSNSLTGLWGNSWTALQGLASSVLGSDITGSSTIPKRRRRPLEATHRRTTSSAPPAQWGPSVVASSSVGVGSREEREALVRARKRQDLLSANSHICSDATGRIKRRTSDDWTSSSAPPGENEDRDALVYVHRVKPADTLAGITIKYDCQATVLRKANRMWPNDSVQSRKVIVLPVDSCTVKGRPVLTPQEEPEEDLLLGGTEITAAAEDTTNTPTPTLSNGWHRRESSSTQTTDHPAPSSTAGSSHADSDPPWTHDSWVLLPNDTSPTEIARLPRRTLGYFPRARRKSLSYSDNPTPSTSLDLPRLPASPSRPPLPNFPSSSSTITNTAAAGHAPRARMHRTSSSASSIPHYPFKPLHGPGGVGTMDRDVRAPGPAPDGLNKLFASHLPSVAPPPEQSVFTPWNPGVVEDAALGAGTSGDAGAGGPGFDLEEVGGKIEGWVRKMAGKAASKLSESASAGSGGKSGVGTAGVTGVGDLIELTDAFEIGGGTEEDGDEGPAGGRLERGRSTETLVSSTNVRTAEGVRDRTRGRSGGVGKGGKSD